jgi:beta-glucosidase
LTGPAHDNVGVQCGGWTSSWQGEMDADLFSGISIKDAFEAILSENGGSLVNTEAEADVVVIAIGEVPYAEGLGDTADLALDGPLALEGNLEALEIATTSTKPVLTLMVSGRPRLIDNYIKDWDAFVMTFLPGTEGNGITDVLFGDKPFVGTLPITWPKTNEQSGETINIPDYLTLDHQFKYDFGIR